MPYPVLDLAGFLTGTWTAERRIEDRLNGVRGAFTGTLSFTRQGSDQQGSETTTPAARPDDPADLGAPIRLLAREEGRLSMERADPVPVYRNHVWETEGSSAEVFFEDGRLFHPLDLSSGADAPAHWCSPDEYEGQVEALSSSEMRWTWRVTGPRKDLVLETRLTRPLPVITVSAVQLTDPAGGLVLVRKRGTSAFMQPGGKPEPGESALAAARRELAEELGLDLPAGAFTHLHTWRGRPANESGVELCSETFAAALPEGATPVPAAEIAELLVLSPAEQAAAAATGVVVTRRGEEYAVAPLLRERILPDLISGAQSASANCVR